MEKKKQRNGREEKFLENHKTEIKGRHLSIRCPIHYRLGQKRKNEIDRKSNFQTALKTNLKLVISDVWFV